MSVQHLQSLRALAATSAVRRRIQRLEAEHDDAYRFYIIGRAVRDACLRRPVRECEFLVVGRSAGRPGLESGRRPGRDRIRLDAGVDPAPTVRVHRSTSPLMTTLNTMSAISVDGVAYDVRAGRIGGVPGALDDLERQVVRVRCPRRYEGGATHGVVVMQVARTATDMPGSRLTDQTQRFCRGLHLDPSQLRAVGRHVDDILRSDRSSSGIRILAEIGVLSTLTSLYLGLRSTGRDDDNALASRVINRLKRLHRMFGAAFELRPDVASVARYATWLTSPRNVARNRPDNDVVVAGRECDEGRLERALVRATNRPELAFRVRIAVSAYRRARRAVMTETASVENAVRDCLGRVGQVKGACAAALLLMECEERRVSRGDTVGTERLVREALGASPPSRPDTPGRGRDLTTTATVRRPDDKLVSKA